MIISESFAFLATRTNPRLPLKISKKHAMPNNLAIDLLARDPTPWIVTTGSLGKLIALAPPTMEVGRIIQNGMGALDPNFIFRDLSWMYGAALVAALLQMRKPMKSESSSLTRKSTANQWQMLYICASLILLTPNLLTWGKTLVELIPRYIHFFVNWYTAHLYARPIITKSISAGIIAMVGDYSAQWVEYIIHNRIQKDKDHVAQPALQGLAAFPGLLSIHGRYHRRRGMSVLCNGALLTGPLMHFGYELFETVLPIAGATASATASSLAAIAHVLADSVLLDSVFVATSFLTTGAMEGIRIRELIPQFKKHYLNSLKASWATNILLLPIQYSCFRYLPVDFRVLSVNFIDIMWDGVISFMAHRSRRGESHL
jgi:hypothetical protein